MLNETNLMFPEQQLQYKQEKNPIIRHNLIIKFKTNEYLHFNQMQL